MQRPASEIYQVMFTLFLEYPIGMSRCGLLVRKVCAS
jgi:hypothetical protein